MAKGRTTTATVTLNNKASVTVSKTLEQIVINDQLVPEPKELNPGVDSRYQ